LVFYGRFHDIWQVSIHTFFDNYFVLILAIRREEIKLAHSDELQRNADLGLPPNASKEAQWQMRRREIDKQFENSASPVFYTMLSLSVATFCAAFIQVKKE